MRFAITMLLLQWMRVVARLGWRDRVILAGGCLIFPKVKNVVERERERDPYVHA